MNHLTNFFEFVYIIVAFFIWAVINEPIYVLLLITLLMLPVGFGFLLAKAF